MHLWLHRPREIQSAPQDGRAPLLASARGFDLCGMEPVGFVYHVGDTTSGRPFPRK